MKLINLFLEYTDEEKKKLGIPLRAIGKPGGRWYETGKYIGKMVKGKFVRHQSEPNSSGRDTKATGAVKADSSEVPVVPRPTKSNPSFEELSRAARNRSYTVMTSQPLGGVRSVTQTGEAASIGKPDGFWFGVGSEWVDWTETEMPQWKGDNLYDVQVNEDECIVIEDEIDMREFHAKYRTRDGSEMIDWQKVSKDAKGVIFKRYFPEFRRRYRWYYTWDIASGCVWDASAIRQVEQIPIT